MTVANFMRRCLYDPQDGYYSTRPAIGAEGDFVTAPTISQMYGELIGLWAVETWRRLGAPDAFYLIELGPGEGILMSDALRAAKLDPAFIAAMRLYLVELSAPLIERQRVRLSAHAPTWASHIEDIPDDAPTILVANEFLDCLPVYQFVHTDRGWMERRVGLDNSNALAWGLAPTVKPVALPDETDNGLVWEISPDQIWHGVAVARRIGRAGGCALLVDYGRDTPGPGDTLQALMHHHKVDPLASPGAADLTVWVDFPAVLAAARDAGDVATTPIFSQALFLARLGIEARATALARARPDQTDIIARQLARLTDPTEMGTLFKACAIHSRGLIPPGFEDAP